MPFTRVPTEAEAFARGPDGLEDEVAEVALAARLDVLEAVNAGSRLGTVEIDVESAVKYYPQPTIDDTTNFNAEIAAKKAAGGGDILLRTGSYNVSRLDQLIGADNVNIRGRGMFATSIIPTDTTGDILPLKDASFCTIEDLFIGTSTLRTAGSLIRVDENGGSSQEVNLRRLRMASGFKCISLGDTAQPKIDDIQFIDYYPGGSSPRPLHSLIELAGATVGAHINRLKNGVAGVASAAFVSITGALVDTVQGDEWDLLSLRNELGVWTSNRILQITNGQWIQLDKLSLEAGTTEDAVTISGGRGVFLDGHFLGKDGITLNGGDHIRLRGHILECEQVAVILGAGATNVDLDMLMTGLSKAATNTHAGVRVLDGHGATGKTRIRGKIGGQTAGGSTVPKYCVDIEGATANNLDVDIEAVGYGTSPVRNLSTADNVEVDDGRAPKLFQKIAAALGLTQALTTSMADVTGTEYSFYSPDFGPGRYQVRAVAQFYGLTVADSAEVQLFNVSFANVPAAAVAQAAPNADPFVAVSAWYEVPQSIALGGFRAYLRARVRNATAARGNLRHLHYEVRKI